MANEKNTKKVQSITNWLFIPCLYKKQTFTRSLLPFFLLFLEHLSNFLTCATFYIMATENKNRKRNDMVNDRNIFLLSIVSRRSVQSTDLSNARAYPKRTFVNFFMNFRFFANFNNFLYEASENFNKWRSSAKNLKVCLKITYSTTFIQFCIPLRIA